MVSVIVPVIFFLLLMILTYAISLLCLKGVLQIIAYGSNRADVRRPVSVRDRARFNIRVS
jgi:hypothetical protein